MKLSFKFKTALISFAVSGTLLTATGIAFFVFVYSFAIGRLDSEIRSLVEAQLRNPVPSEFWQDFERSLQFIYKGKDSGQVALMVLDSQDYILTRTDNIPDEFAMLSCPDVPEASWKDSEPPRMDHGRHPSSFEPPPDLFEFDGDHSPDFHDRPVFPIAEHFQTLETGGIKWRVGILRNPEITVILALDMDAAYAEINRFRDIFITVVPPGLVLLGLAGWFLAGRAMKPVAVIAGIAEGVTAKGLDRRIPPVGRDTELQRLVSVINGMLDRLEKSYHQAVRFSADAAHELQTPLTILQGELDNAIQTAPDGSDEQQRCSMLLGELQNLKAVVQKLLLLSHADEGRLNLNLVLVNLSELISDAAEDLEIIAPNLSIQTHITTGIHIPADIALLRQAVRNLTSNAAKYTAENGEVLFELKKEKHTIYFTLSNFASPIPDEDRTLIFRRFHRVEKSRTTAGSGLGLSLALEIARAHGGDVVLNSYNKGKVSFTLSLPAA